MMTRAFRLAICLLGLLAAFGPAGRALAYCPPPAFDYSDSYASTYINSSGWLAVDLTQPVYDPATGSYTYTLWEQVVPQTYLVSVGYDYWDRSISTDSVVSGVPSAESNQLGTFGTISNLHTVEQALVVTEPTGGCGALGSAPDGTATDSPLSHLEDGATASITGGLLVSDLTKLGATGVLESLGPNKLRVTQVERGTLQKTLTRTFERENGVWKLREAVFENRATSAEATFRAEYKLTFDVVAWNLNEKEEARRASLAAERKATRGATDDRDFLSAVLGGPALEPRFSEAPPAAAPTAWPGDPNVVFQHGLASSADTWRRMDPWLSSTFRFGTKLLPSLSALSSLSNQTNQLIPQMDASGANQFIMIGHSQGGLISRRVGQLRPDLVRGVISIGTPHNGALLALNSRTTISNQLANLAFRLASGCYTPYDDPGCFIAYVLLQSFIGVGINYAFDAAAPATGDLIPNSSFLQTLNATPESFTGVGVENRANPRWVLMRLGGDAFCDPESGCGGRAWARYTNLSYIGFRSCTFLSLIFGYWGTANVCNSIASSMDRVDAFWNRLYANNTGGDGVVHTQGQVYNRAVARYIISDSDSHVGETKSDKVRARVTEALDRQFAVPRAAIHQPD